MPRSRRPEVEISFGGKARHLVFGHHALGELEEKAAELTAASRIKSVILATWAGLLTETLDPQGRDTTRTLSRFQVAQIFDTMEDSEIEDLAAKVTEAMNLAKPVENPTPASEEPQKPSEN